MRWRNVKNSFCIVNTTNYANVKNYIESLVLNYAIKYYWRVFTILSEKVKVDEIIKLQADYVALSKIIFTFSVSNS